MTCAECKWWRHDNTFDADHGYCINPEVGTRTHVYFTSLPEHYVAMIAFAGDFGCIFAERKESDEGTTT